MKRFSLYSIMAIAFMLMFSLTSCDKENTTGPLGPGTPGPDYVLASPDLLDGVVINGTENAEFALQAENDKLLFVGPGNCPRGPQNNQPIMLGRLLSGLELTDLQRADVDGYMAAFRLCVLDNKTDLRDAQLPIIQAANASRLLIIADLRAGTITVVQARAALETLRQATRLAMDTDVDVIAARAALKDCHDTLLASIYAVLTPAQIIKWNIFFHIV